MPLYEYRCKTCGESFEKMVRWSETDRAQVCPQCQSQDTQKKISVIGSSGASSGSSAAVGSGCGTGGFS